jgi:hypothetical protein
MTDHLSTLQIQRLSVSALPEDELVAAVLHTTKCQSCHQQFVEELRRQRGSAPFTFTLEPEFWFRDDHLEFEDLVGLADNTFDKETLEIINIHLSTCETCREDVRSFLAFRDVTAREKDISYARPEYQTTSEAGVTPWWRRLQPRPVYAVAAIVLVTLVVLIGVIALNTKSDRLEANNQDQTTPGIERSPGISPSPTQNAVSSPSSVDDSAKVAKLKDGGGEVTIDLNGRVTGLDQVSKNSRQYIAQATLSEQVEPTDVLRRLSGEQSGLRGNDSGQKGFSLLYPVRRVVTEDRPVFRWERLPGVSSYQVYLLDANGKQVGQSEELQPTQTQWKARGPLRRGQIFSWVVTALVEGKKVVSPSASAPEIKFAVLSTADLQELTRLKKSKSHLALGVFYARAGLLDEAEREFQSLIKLNPGSELPRKLLQSVHSVRKGN